MFEEQVALTPNLIRDILQESFPGVPVEFRPFTGGTVARVVIWQFTLDITLTIYPVIFTEKEGQVRMSLQWRPPGSKMIPIKSGGTSELKPLVTFVRQCKGYLEGIAAAILMATAEPAPEPEANLF